MNTTSIKLYDIFRHDLKLSEVKAKELVATLDDAIKSEDVATKPFVQKEISDAKSDIIKWVAAMLIGQTALIITLIKLLS